MREMLPFYVKQNVSVGVPINRRLLGDKAVFPPSQHPQLQFIVRFSRTAFCHLETCWCNWTGQSQSSIMRPGIILPPPRTTNLNGFKYGTQ